MKIGYQGTLGSFSQIASRKLFGEVDMINYLTFKDVIKNVLEGNVDFGVLPIENSYTGVISGVLDELYLSNVYIVEMYNLPIKQNLIGIKESSLSDIKQVYSHEQALMQCSEFLQEHNLEIIPFVNTALASQYVKNENDKTKAAIASDLSAEIYDLKILKSGINNNNKNTTRFAIVSKKLGCVKDNFAFMFTVKDGSGALASILNEISRLGVNLTSISSHSTHEEWKYYFFCEAEGRLESENILQLQKILKDKCATFKIIGSY